MIEKYFMLGVRLKWTFPGDHSTGSMDGSIIDNPARPIQSMVYDGVDGELHSISAPHVSTVGLTKGMNIQHNWLTYSVGHTAKVVLSADTLTGYMSGCLITLWHEGSHSVIGHIGTVDSSKSISARVKQAFDATMPSDTTGFNPLDAWNAGEIGGHVAKFKKGAEPKILGLVTGSGVFYSLLTFKLAGLVDEWCVGGIKLVPPMTRAELHTHLTKPDT